MTRFSLRLLMAAMVCLNLMLPENNPVWAYGEDAIRMDNNAIQHFHQGEMWASLGRWEAAVREYQIAIRLKPTTSMSASCYNNLGLAFLKLGLIDRGIAAFQEAITLNPNFSLYYENLVKAYGQGGSADEAVSRLQMMTANNPSNASAWFLLGFLHKAAGDTEASRHAFESYIRLVPNSELTDAAKLNLTPSSSSQPGKIDVQSWQK